MAGGIKIRVARIISVLAFFFIFSRGGRFERAENYPKCLTLSLFYNPFALEQRLPNFMLLRFAGKKILIRCTVVPRFTRRKGSGENRA